MVWWLIRGHQRLETQVTRRSTDLALLLTGRVQRVNRSDTPSWRLLICSLFYIALFTACFITASIRLFHLARTSIIIIIDRQ